MASSITIGGVTITAKEIAYKGITVSTEKIWSKDTGRDTSGFMAGKVIGVKHTFKIKLSRLTADKYTRIESVVSGTSNPFFSASICDGVKTYTGQYYAGSSSQTVYADVLGTYFDYSFDLIEK